MTATRLATGCALHGAAREVEPDQEKQEEVEAGEEEVVKEQHQVEAAQSSQVGLVMTAERRLKVGDRVGAGAA